MNEESRKDEISELFLGSVCPCKLQLEAPHGRESGPPTVTRAPLGKLTGVFLDLYYFAIVSARSAAPKQARKSLWNINTRKESMGGYQYDWSLHLYIRQKESTGWFFLKIFISSKELFFLIMFFATCRHVFLCARGYKANRLWSRSCNLLHVNNQFKRFIQWKAWCLFQLV